MEDYKRKMIINKIVVGVALLFCVHLGKAQQKGYTLKEADSLIKRIDAITKKQVKKNVDVFMKDGSASSLWNAGDYKALRQYSKKIRNKLFECYKSGKGCNATHYNRRVLALLDLPQYMKDSLLRYKHTEREVRAAVGDTIAQQEIIKSYRDFLNTDIKTDTELYDIYYKKNIGLSLLLYIGTEESIRIFLEGMNTTDVFEDTNTPYGLPKNKVSVFYRLLGSYSGLLSNDPLVSHFYFQTFLYTENEKEPSKEYQDYLRQLEKYFYDKHKVRITIKAPYLIQGQEYVIEH
jgi:hypothetical protein